jgi:hypothetical protein
MGVYIYRDNGSDVGYYVWYILYPFSKQKILMYSFYISYIYI